MFREQAYFSNVGQSVMQQNYYNNFINNQAFLGQPMNNNQMIIAGPIYKNTPIFIGPSYLSKSLLDPVIRQPNTKRESSQRKSSELWEEENFMSSRRLQNQQVNDTLKSRFDFMNQWMLGDQNEKSAKTELKDSDSNIVQRRKHTKQSLQSVPEEKPSVFSKPKPKYTKQRLLQLLRIHFMNFRFCIHYFQHLKKLLLAKRRRAFQLSGENINKAMETGTEVILTILEQTLYELLKSKESLNWLETNQIAAKEQKNRIKKCTIYIDQILDRLEKATSDLVLPDELLRFLVTITQNYEYPPQGYYFNFELVRLSFTSFAALAKMKESHHQLIISLFFIIRILCFTILYGPWTIGLHGVSMTPLIKQNGLIITSIIHEIILSEYRSLLKENKFNQNHLPIENRLNPRQQGPLKYEPEPADPKERKRLKELMEPVIYPVYAQTEMKLLFDENKEWVNKTRTRFNQIVIKIVRAVGIFHSKDKIRLSSQANKLWI